MAAARGPVGIGLKSGGPVIGATASLDQHLIEDGLVTLGVRRCEPGRLRRALFFRALRRLLRSEAGRG